MTASVFPFVAPPARSGLAMLAPTTVELVHTNTMEATK